MIRISDILAIVYKHEQDKVSCCYFFSRAASCKAILAFCSKLNMQNLNDTLNDKEVFEFISIVFEELNPLQKHNKKKNKSLLFDLKESLMSIEQEAVMRSLYNNERKKFNLENVTAIMKQKNPLQLVDAFESLNIFRKKYQAAIGTDVPELSKLVEQLRESTSPRKYLENRKQEILNSYLATSTNLNVAKVSKKRVRRRPTL